MACYHPIEAQQDEPGQVPRFNIKRGTGNLALPCGKCIGCKSSYATQWANRCTHETTQWKNNCFLTLTYDDDHIPEDGALRPDHLQKFLRKLRKRARDPTSAIDRDRNYGLRFFGCGEYGEQEGRPHYHLLLFNCNFADRYRVHSRLTESPLVGELWEYGSNRIGEATAAAANYIAQYSLKKQSRRNYISADGVDLPHPFLRMSVRPAIGLAWLDQYETDLHQGYLVAKQHKQGIPRYYKKKIKERNRELAEEIQWKIEQNRQKHPNDRNLESAEKIHTRLKHLTSNRTL